MNRRCHRCDGLLTHDSSWSPIEAYTHLNYLKCVNCGNYQFDSSVSGIVGLNAPDTKSHRKQQRRIPYKPFT